MLFPRSYLNREIVLQQMANTRSVGGGLVCFDSDFNYYQLGVAGYLLMYKRRRFKPDARRCFMLTDELARCLNFQSLNDMKYFLPGIQYWRGFVSVERLKAAFLRYDDKWGNLLEDIG